MQKYDGHNGQIIVETDTLVITRDGLVARAGFGKGAEPRRVPLQAVSGVALQEATRLKNGWLSLGLGGAAAPVLSTGSAASNADAVLFTHKHRDEFQQLHDWLLSVVAANVAAGVDWSAVEVAPGGQVGRFDKVASGLAEKSAGMVERAQARRDGAADAVVTKQQGKQEKAEAAGVRPDIAAAMSRMGWKLGGGREIKKLPEHLYENERVEFMAQGTYAGSQGLVVMTDARLLFLFHGLTKQTLEDFPYKSISSVQSKAGMATGELTVHASGNKAVITGILKPDLKFLADALRQRLAGGAAAAAAAAPAAAPDVMDQLRKLGELRAAGVLNEAEFEAKKTELLSRL